MIPKVSKEQALLQVPSVHQVHLAKTNGRLFSAEYISNKFTEPNYKQNFDDMSKNLL